MGKSLSFKPKHLRTIQPPIKKQTTPISRIIGLVTLTCCLHWVGCLDVFQEFSEDLALNVTREKQKHTRTRHAFPRALRGLHWALLQLFQSGKKRAKFGDGAPCNSCWVSWMMEICGILWLSEIILIHTIPSKLMVANLGTKIAFLIFRGTNVTFFSVALVLSLYGHNGNIWVHMFLTLPCESQPPIVATGSIWDRLVQYTYMKIRKNPIKMHQTCR